MSVPDGVDGGWRMGFHNPPSTFADMRARLDGRGGGFVADRIAAVPQAGEAADAARASTAPDIPAPPAVPYAELHAHSAYSFLDGASMPEKLVAEARRLGLVGLAITDHDGFYGAVRMAEAIAASGGGGRLGGEASGSRPFLSVYGAELSLGLSGPQNGMPDPEGTHLLALARGPEGYHALAKAITTAQLAGGEKGRPVYDIEQLGADLAGHVTLLTGCRKSPVRRALEPERGRFDVEAAATQIDRLTAIFGQDSVVAELYHHGDPLDDQRNAAIDSIARRLHLRTVATGNVHYATPDDYRLAQALAAVRARRSIDDAESWLPAAGAAHLRSGAEMLARFGRFVGAVENTVDVAAECAFPLRSVSPRLPTLDVPPGLTPMQHLRALAWRGAERKYPHLPEGHRQRIERELQVIEEKDFPGYFLIVYDIVQFARSRGILCQGRGSAAASAVCYLLDVTAVDAIFYDLPFERFLSTIRDEEPDIDVDFDSDRREEVIQYVYEKYGRRNAAQVANVISFTPKNAVRDMAKALGFGPGQQDAWSKTMDRGALSARAAAESSGSAQLPGAGSGSGSSLRSPSSLASAGTSVSSTVPSTASTMASSMASTTVSTPTPPAAAASTSADPEIPPSVIALATQLQGMPRHLGIHSGGMVLTDRPIGEVVPIEHARMERRTVLQWDKDDCEWMGLVKFDLLGLGILSAIQRTFDLVEVTYGRRLDMDAIPKEEAAVYDALCRADAIGVFQVESRAQLGLLPRLRPRSFYDLTVEVALIRPGPIQGGAVHPFVERRNDPSKVRYLHPLLEPILERTLGVPIFQEQIISMAVALSDLDAEEADLLRRAFGSKRGQQRIDSIRVRMVNGMRARGMTDEAIAAVYAQIEAFANFGFAESHSLSFALLVYASAWLKVHYPAAYLAGLLRAQPMGFYSPATLVADARRHGVVVVRPDISLSRVDAELEPVDAPVASPAAIRVPGASVPSPGVARGRARVPESGQPGCLDRQQPAVGLFDPQAPDRGAEHRRDAGVAVRLGLAGVRGIGRRLAERIVAERDARGPFASMEDLVRRTDVTQAQVEALATAGAFDSLGRDRRQALWHAGQAAQDRAEFLSGSLAAIPVPLFEMPSDRDILSADLWATGISVDDHRMRYVRPALAARGVLRAVDLVTAEPGRRVEVAGLVIHRQRPGTAGGTVFVNLEDESGMVNVIFSAGAWLRFRPTARRASALLVRGMLERSPEGVVNIVADWCEAVDVGGAAVSRDFR